MLTETPPIAGRYQLIDFIGEGGMGAVYRATDRLTGTPVALKQVLKAPADLEFASRSNRDSDLNLALAQEFQSLATLRHPNIISVLDYGFDQKTQPYFTMELLDHSRTIAQAGNGQPLSYQVNILAQVFQALAYLHRRGILHRDLKPGNVLVVDNQVKVLDFGLSVAMGQDKDISGTLAYIAPEVLQGQGASAASDLYAVGILAYEMLTGKHPFEADSASKLIDSILFGILDLTSVAGSPLAAVIGRLLSKSPDDRFSSANDAIQALNELLDHDHALPLETEATRESFLQAAQFVGRQQEFAQLTEALTQTAQKHSSLWLVGGESGVGKSRLIDELRIRALVQGFVVLRGQAISVGSGSYQAWRDAIRLLALLSVPDDLQAGILKPILLDIAGLLGRTLPDAPEIDPDKAETRLFSTISDLLRRQSIILIVLEDLQWASPQDLKLLEWLGRDLADWPLLLIGTYRDDEKPDLPSLVPGTRRLKLERLATSEIEALSQSMLGESGTNPEVLSLLKRETEGNVFFLVEVVRALAEEAGTLEKIGRITLPTQVFAGGVQRIIQRRLKQAAENDRPFLQLAAVAGRQLDLAVLQAADPAIRLERWLTDCANVAVLDVSNGSWRFAHDKLREALLADLSTERRSELHKRVAVAIETVYADTNSQAAALAYHWAEAGNPDKERHYSLIAGQQATARFAHEEAIRYFKRAMALATTGKLSIMFALAQVWQTTGEWTAAEALVYEAIAIPPETPEERRLQADFYRLRGWLNLGTKPLEDTLSWLNKARAIYESLNDQRGLAKVYSTIGRCYADQSDHATARAYYERQHTTALAVGDRHELLNVLYNFGYLYSLESDFERSLDYNRQALTIARELNNPKELAEVYSRLAIGYENLGDHAQAADYQARALEFQLKVGDVYKLSHLFIEMGGSYKQRGQYIEGITCCEQGLRTSVRLGDHGGSGIALIYMTECYAYQERFEEAERTAILATALVRKRNLRYHMAGFLNTSTLVYWLQDKYTEALPLNTEALALATQVNFRDVQFDAGVMRIRLRLALGQIDTAAAIAELQQMLTAWPEEPRQAVLQSVIALIDPAQEVVRQSAIALCEKLYNQSLNSDYRRYYQQLTGRDFLIVPVLPELPTSIPWEPVNISGLLRQIERWIIDADIPRHDLGNAKTLES